MPRGFSTIYSSTTNDFRYTHRSTDHRTITRPTAGRGCHVSLCPIRLDKIQGIQAFQKVSTRDRSITDHGACKNEYQPLTPLQLKPVFGAKLLLGWRVSYFWGSKGVKLIELTADVFDIILFKQ